MIAIGAVGLVIVGGRLHSGPPQPAGSRGASPRPTPVPPSPDADSTTPLQSEPPQMVNATGGTVAEATARAWATAYLASVHWTIEAVERERPDLLDHLYGPGQADPATLRLINDAHAGGATLSYPLGREPHASRLILVALSAEQQAAIGRDGGALGGPDAWVVTWTGATDLQARWPGGRVQTYSVLGDGEQVTELSVGSVVFDPTLGAVWRETTSRDCTAHPDPVLCPF